jgi:hypothetical protein
MANVTELINDVDDADKRSDNDKYLDGRYRKAQAYEALDHLLTTALYKSETLQSRVADDHKASPMLARHLARWAVGNVDPTARVPLGTKLAPASVPGLFFFCRTSRVRLWR